MIAKNIYQFNLYTAFGGFYTNGGIYANTDNISATITPEIELLDNDGVFLLDNDGAELLDNG